MMALILLLLCKQSLAEPYCMREHSDLLVLLNKLLDWAFIIGGGLLCFYVLEPSKNFPVYECLMPVNYLHALGMAFLLSAWWFPAFNVYKSWRGESLFEEIRTLLFGWSACLIALLVFMVFTKTTTEFSRHWMGLWFVSVFLALMLSRIMLRFLLRSIRKKGLNQRHIVIVGNGRHTRQVIERVQKSDWMGLSIRGIFANPEPIASVCSLGSADRLLPFLEHHDIDQIWMTFSLKDMDQIDRLCRQLHSIAIEVILIPDMSSLRLLNHSVSQMDGNAGDSNVGFTDEGRECAG